MSYFYKFEPKLELKKVTFKTQDYLYIKEEDQNIESDEDSYRISIIFEQYVIDKNIIIPFSFD